MLLPWSIMYSLLHRDRLSVSIAGYGLLRFTSLNRRSATNDSSHNVVYTYPFTAGCVSVLGSTQAVDVRISAYKNVLTLSPPIPLRLYTLP